MQLLGSCSFPGVQGDPVSRQFDFVILIGRVEWKLAEKVKFSKAFVEGRPEMEAYRLICFILINLISVSFNPSLMFCF